jgi:putative flippase GtrA
VTPTNERQRFIFFLLAGGIAAIVNVLSRIALNSLMRYEIAIVVAYLCGMTTAFVLNKFFVFERSGRGTSAEYVRFGIVNLAAVAQVWIVSVGFARFVFPAMGFEWHAETVAHVIGVMVPVFTSYLGHKHFTFAARSRPNAD